MAIVRHLALKRKARSFGVSEYVNSIDLINNEISVSIELSQSLIHTNCTGF